MDTVISLRGPCNESPTNDKRTMTNHHFSRRVSFIGGQHLVKTASRNISVCLSLAILIIMRA
jgi:hypothetical protein